MLREYCLYIILLNYVDVLGHPATEMDKILSFDATASLHCGLCRQRQPAGETVLCGRWMHDSSELFIVLFSLIMAYYAFDCNSNFNVMQQR